MNNVLEFSTLNPRNCSHFSVKNKITGLKKDGPRYLFSNKFVGILIHFKAGVHNSNLMAGQNFFCSNQGPKLIILTHSKGVFNKEISKINKIWGFAGQI